MKLSKEDILYTVQEDLVDRVEPEIDMEDETLEEFKDFFSPQRKLEEPFILDNCLDEDDFHPSLEQNLGKSFDRVLDQIEAELFRKNRSIKI